MELTATLAHRPNWNDGQWELDGQAIRIHRKKFNELNVIIDGDPNLVLEAYAHSGEDHDMGATWRWTSTRFRIRFTYNADFTFYHNIPEGASFTIPRVVLQPVLDCGAIVVRSE